MVAGYGVRVRRTGLRWRYVDEHGYLTRHKDHAVVLPRQGARRLASEVASPGAMVRMVRFRGRGGPAPTR